MSDALPSPITVQEVQERLRQIFPAGTPNRGYCTREIAAKTVFVMLYVGAVERTGVFLRPNQVTRMTDTQAAMWSDPERRAWTQASLSKARRTADGWYATDTREPIRDETLRDGLVPVGAVLVRVNLPTTSALPRYCLAEPFAKLFHPGVSGGRLKKAIKSWQSKHLSRGALARIQLVHSGATASKSGVMVTFPSGETRRLVEGPSSVISKAVIEEFARRFLHQPGVIVLSESANKVVARDDSLARKIGLAIPADRYLPDILLVDIAPKDPVLVFVEAVATNGAITETRKEAFLRIAGDAGFGEGQVVCVTAYADRNSAAFKKTIPELAWDSFAWFVSEPDHLLVLRGKRLKRASKVSALL